mmetsp:Transcript_11137/g.34605  ORF Transcript_11137/g.34605 Transcript_11137/m.34605 type:complete len:292 (-) Transcript_11137:266-1141(-)
MLRLGGRTLLAVHLVDTVVLGELLHHLPAELLLLELLLPAALFLQPLLLLVLGDHELLIAAAALCLRSSGLAGLGGRLLGVEVVDELLQFLLLAALLVDPPGLLLEDFCLRRLLLALEFLVGLLALALLRHEAPDFLLFVPFALRLVGQNFAALLHECVMLFAGRALLVELCQVIQVVLLLHLGDDGIDFLLLAKVLLLREALSGRAFRGLLKQRLLFGAQLLLLCESLLHFDAFVLLRGTEGLVAPCLLFDLFTVLCLLHLLHLVAALFGGVCCLKLRLQGAKLRRLLTS